MRNRAKCRLCGSIIESFHAEDYVSCKCDEIAVDGGTAMRCYAKSWDNFMRVDDVGNEVIIKLKDDDVKPLYNEEQTKEITRKELMDMLRGMIESIERLPQGAMLQPITHYDLVSALLLVESLFKADS